MRWLHETFIYGAVVLSGSSIYLAANSSFKAARLKPLACSWQNVWSGLSSLVRVNWHLGAQTPDRPSLVWWVTRCHTRLDGIIYPGHSHAYCLTGNGGVHREPMLVYPVPDAPLLAATAIITLEECGTLVLNSLWPPCWRRSGGGHSLRGGGVGIQSVGAGWVLCVFMYVWWPRDIP